jgi:hypothetical protein
MLGKIISAAVLAGAAATAGYIAKKKNPDFCPECDIRKAVAKLGVHIKTTEKYDNGAALTPPMGWSSWNSFRTEISEKKILQIADAMKKSGLLDAGYNYVNLDDCWHSSTRDADGRLRGDLATFPRGIKPLVEDLNKMGFKAGIYSSNGTLTCEDLPASLGNERIDAETFAEWGIEYFKYDFCHNKAITSKAPLIDKVIITDKNGGNEQILEAENGELYGTAKIVEDKDGSYVSRLDSNMGSVRFSFVNVPEDGEYALTLVVRKAGDNKKYATVTVNDINVYPVDIPPTKAWSRTGRCQITVNLNKGDNTIEIKNPIGSRMDSAATQYINMGKELKRATKLYAEKNNVPEKPIVYSICEWGTNKPWKWGAQAGNLWRTTPDIKPVWASILGIYEVNVKLADYSGIGGWNDPDMLEVGNGKLTVEENKSHFTLWCMLCAPLILGNDIRTFIDADGNVDYENKILQIVTNKDLIAVNQDKKGVQCRRMKTNAISDILVKPLDKGEVAICFFNKSNAEKDMSVSLKDVANLSYVELNEVGAYQFTDLWSKEIDVTSGSINARVPSHGVRVFRVKSI